MNLGWRAEERQVRCGEALATPTAAATSTPTQIDVHSLVQWFAVRSAQARRRAVG